MSEHPGRAALQRILLKTNPPSDGVLALMYIEERLAALERTVADRSAKFAPPSAKEVTDYAASINFALDGQHFCDFYEARNWHVGKVKMKSWKAAVRTWKTSSHSFRSDTQPKPGPRLPDNLLPDDHFDS